MTQTYLNKMRNASFAEFRKAGIPLRDEEKEQIEIADFGLGDFENEGAAIATLVATDRYSVKALHLLPGQTLPEHWHPPIGEDPGKQETVRVVRGICFLVVEGDGALSRSRIPPGKQTVYTCTGEQVFTPGDQQTLSPGQKHWFQGGPDGTVVYSFSSTVRDLQDGFTDPAIRRAGLNESG